MGYNSPPGDEIKQVLTRIDDIMRRVSELERPTGTQVYDALAELRQLVEDLPGQINAALAIVVNTGTVNTTGNVNVGADAIVTGFVYTPAGYGYDITYTRRAAWLGNDGRLGWASSSIENKELVKDVPPPDPLAILEISDVYYTYKSEVAKREEDPAYKVQLEYGHIAEWLHAAGLWQAVIYENGKPVGIHDNVLAGFAIRATQHVWRQHLALEKRVAALEN